MTRRLWAVLAGLWAVEAVLLLLPGHLAITGHEVDVLHATDAAMRLVDGQAQHLDFLTPLGVMAFLPIAWLLQAGFGAATALLLANLLVALAILPALVRVGASRMNAPVAIIFGVIGIVLCTGLVFGGTASTVSMSLYYNRWAWVAAFVAVALILLPPRDDAARPALDGALLGAMLSFLALLKMSYFVAVAPAVLVALLVERNLRMMLAAGLVGALAIAIATVIGGGLGYWLAYAGDLNFVRMSDIRPKPGEAFGHILSGPKFLPGTIILLAAVIGLRKTGWMAQGLILLLLVPGFAFITYQNWGNDPQWLLVVGVLCLAWSAAMGDKPLFGTEARTVFFSLGLAALALASPSFLNVMNSPVRNIYADRADYWPLMADPRHDGLLIARESSFAPAGQVELASVEDPGPPPEEQEADNDGPLVVDGIELAECTLKTGYFGTMREIARSLSEKGFERALIGYAASFNPLPLVGGFAREPNRAPWYYGGTEGIGNAQFVVAPTCPVSFPPFRHYLEALDEAGFALRLDHETPHYRLFRLSRKP